MRDMHNEIIRRLNEKLTVREKKKATIEKIARSSKEVLM